MRRILCSVVGAQARRNAMPMLYFGWQAGQAGQRGSGAAGRTHRSARTVGQRAGQAWGVGGGPKRRHVSILCEPSIDQKALLRPYNASSVIRRPSSVIRRPSSVVRRPSSVARRPSPVVRRPSSVVRHPSSVIRRPSSVARRPSPMIHQPPQCRSDPNCDPT